MSFGNKPEAIAAAKVYTDKWDAHEIVRLKRLKPKGQALDMCTSYIPVYSVVWSPCGEFVAIKKYCSLAILRVSDGKTMFTLNGQDGVRSAAWHPSSESLVTGWADNRDLAAVM